MARSERHERLVDLVRFKLIPRLRELGYPYVGGWADDSTMAMTLGLPTPQRGGQAPDLIITPAPDIRVWPVFADWAPSPEEYDTLPLLVEVGNFCPSKWPEYLPVMHVGFNLRVSLVNATGRVFEQIAVREMRFILAQEAARDPALRFQKSLNRRQVRGANRRAHSR